MHSRLADSCMAQDVRVEACMYNTLHCVMLYLWHGVCVCVCVCVYLAAPRGPRVKL